MRKTIITTFMICIFSMFVIGCSGLNKAQMGAGIGALGGAAVGAHLGPDSSSLRNAAIGAGIGTIFGYMIGNEMGKYDKRQMRTTLENTPDHQSNTWVNPNTGKRYKATPIETKITGSQPVRTIRIKADTDNDGHFDDVVYTKAKRVNGRWVIDE